MSKRSFRNDYVKTYTSLERKYPYSRSFVRVRITQMRSQDVNVLSVSILPKVGIDRKQHWYFAPYHSPTLTSSTRRRICLQAKTGRKRECTPYGGVIFFYRRVIFRVSATVRFDPDITSPFTRHFGPFTRHLRQAACRAILFSNSN